MESRKCADVNFEVDGEIFAAHKLVIAARSPVFRAQLFGPLKDKDTRCIKVEDIEAPVFKVLSLSHSISHIHRQIGAFSHMQSLKHVIVLNSMHYTSQRAINALFQYRVIGALWNELHL